MKIPMADRSKHSVFHISTVHQPFDIRIFHKECKSLLKPGFEVYYVGRGSSDFVSTRIKTIFLRERGSRIQRMIFSPWEAFRKVKRTSSKGIIHIHDPELIPMALWAKLNGFAIIYDAHEDLPKQVFSKEWIPSVFRGFVSNASRFFLSLALKYFDGVVAATDSICDSIRHHNKVAVKNYPILQELDEKESIIVTDKKDYLVYSGDLSEDRGLFGMLDIVAAVKMELVLAGRFSNDDTKHRAYKHEGWKFVRFVGWLPRKELAKVQKKALLGLCLLSDKPNHRQAYPTKLFEYMMHGVPVVCSNFEGWVQLIQENNCGICVDFNDIKQQIQAVESYMSSPQKAILHGTNGQQIIRNSLNWGKEEVALIDFYNKILT